MTNGKRISAILPLMLAVAGLVALFGCQGDGPGPSAMARSDHGLSPLYGERYTGPLKATPMYQTFEQITFTDQGGDYDPAVSPDGTMLIYASTAQSVQPDIFMVSVGAGKSLSTRTQLTSTPWAEIQPCFSPDSKSFAYASYRRGNWDIYVEPLKGSSQWRCITEGSKDDEISPNWHPWGEWIAFSTFSQRTMRWELAMKNLKTGHLRRLGEGLFPKFSPDGRRIAFQRARDREPRWFSIYILDLDEELNAVGSPIEVVYNAKWAAINPAWSPDGRYLTFATVHESPAAQSTRRVLMGDDIWAVNVDGQDLTQLTTSPEPESHPFWARGKDGRNGRIYFCSKQRGPRNIWSLMPRLPEVYGTVAGALPGPAPVNVPPVHPEGKEPPAETAPVKAPPTAPPKEPAPAVEKTEPAVVPPLPPPASSKTD
jgi:Tol biopolymer transport system component